METEHYKRLDNLSIVHACHELGEPGKKVVVSGDDLNCVADQFFFELVVMN